MEIIKTYISQRMSKEPALLDCCCFNQQSINMSMCADFLWETLPLQQWDASQGGRGKERRRMRVRRIIRAEGGGGHGDHVVTQREVCERDKARMNMIRMDQSWQSPWWYLRQHELTCTHHVHRTRRCHFSSTVHYPFSCNHLPL